MRQLIVSTMFSRSYEKDVCHNVNAGYQSDVQRRTIDRQIVKSKDPRFLVLLLTVRMSYS